MSTTQALTQKWPSGTKPTVTKIFPQTQSSSATTVQFANRKEVVVSDRLKSPLNGKPKWRDREYRQAYMEASIDQGIAWQIRINRKFRSMSQTELAQSIGTRQSAISRFEDPEYGAHSLETLKQIANVFDCALAVQFISYGDLARQSDRLSETDQYAVPFSLELEQCDDNKD